MLRVVLVVSSVLIFADALCVAQDAVLPAAELSADAQSEGGLSAWRIAAHGDLIGATTLAGNQNAGSLIVQRRNAQAIWIREATIAPESGAVNDLFGSSLAVGNDVIAVGSPGANSSAGSVQVFRFANGAWSAEATLTAADSSYGQFFGSSVALSGDLLVTGAMLDGESLTGAAYVFRHGANGWQQEAKLTASHPESASAFGIAVAVDGELVAVGAPEASGSDAAKCGAVYLYHKQNESWPEHAILAASDAGANDHLGWSVAVSGSAVLVGAPFDDDCGDDAGAAYLFRQDAGSDAWSQETKFTASAAAPGEVLGRAVALDGDRALIGAPAACPGGMHVGSALLFKRNEGAWACTGRLGTQASDAADVPFGSSVTITDQTIATGVTAGGDGSIAVFSGE